MIQNTPHHLSFIKLILGDQSLVLISLDIQILTHCLQNFAWIFENVQFFGRLKKITFEYYPMFSYINCKILFRCPNIGLNIQLLLCNNCIALGCIIIIGRFETYKSLLFGFLNTEGRLESLLAG